MNQGFDVMNGTAKREMGWHVTGCNVDRWMD